MSRSLILQCPHCREYSLRDVCPKCAHKTANPLPPKFSPEDAYGSYRRRLRRENAARGR